MGVLALVVYVDEHFAPFSLTAIHSKRLLVTTESISWGEESIELDRLVAVNYSIQLIRATNGVFMVFSYNINLYGRDRGLRISIYANQRQPKQPSRLIWRPEQPCTPTSGPVLSPRWSTALNRVKRSISQD